jgi:hypothetical protein
MRDLTVDELRSLITMVDTEINHTEQSIKNYSDVYGEELTGTLKDIISYHIHMKNKLKNRLEELKLDATNKTNNEYNG